MTNSSNVKNLFELLRRDIIDSRQIFDRIKELKLEGLELKNEISDKRKELNFDKIDSLIYQKKDIENEIALLQDFCKECKNYTSEFEYGAAIISWHYFEDYCQEMAKDFGYLPNLDRHTFNPIHNFIDWKSWAEFQKMNYSEISCNGYNFFIENQ